MTRVLDKLLLFLYSLAVAAASVIILLEATGLARGLLDWLSYDKLNESLLRQSLVIAVCAVVLLISLRFLYVTLKVSSSHPSSIDQRTDFGDIRISPETIENLTLKAASRVKGVKDLKVRVLVGDTGLDLTVRSVVDGDMSIPAVTEEVQRSVKHHLEETTGIPVYKVSVYVANIVQSQTFKSRVE